ncbi:peptidoglycan-binding protein [Microvirga arabica]|uniref:Peptidoglycan-binding protein n=1 Tax=Microvirga arabica TaxID=1128671 RepID=A0ABV6Y7Z0_9HYPH
MPVALTDALRNEYSLLFSRMSLRPERMQDIDRIYRRIMAPGARERYFQVEQETGVPWFFIAIIHNLEASGRFDRHLHNGDPLTGPTFHVPANRPSRQKRSYTWVESAADALRLKKFHKASDSQWTVPDIAFALESFNGFGYRNRYPHVKSPYLWSFSNIYTCGKYIQDGVFSEIAVSQQCGGLSMLRHMIDSNNEIAKFVSAQPLMDDDQDHTQSFPWCDGPEGEEVPDMPAARNVKPYPGRYLVFGIEDDEDVRTLQQRLVYFGFDPGIIDGDFGEVTERAVMLFQARSADLSGEPLEIDGVVGPSTWGALFGPLSVRGQEKGPDILKAPASVLSEAVLAIAAREIGVREFPLGSNRGPRVDQYVTAAGLTPAGRHAWCMCFVYWCFEQAARQIGMPNPCPKKASVHMAWQACQNAVTNGRHDLTVVRARDAHRDPSKVRPGMVFFIDTGGGTGHVGLVDSHHNGALETIEGNTNDNGSREGVGVFRRSRRKINQINLGFVSF